MKHKRVNKFTYLIAFIVLAGILLSNGCAIETEKQAKISTDEPEATETQVIPTETEMPTYVVQDSLEVFTPAQEALNQSPEALAQQERFQRWLDYWVKFDNRPFAPGSVDIHWKPVYDNPQNPTEVIMLLEVGGPDYKNATFLPPHNADGPIDYPPEVSGSEIAPGLGPMEIDLNKDGTVTRAYQGTLARFDSQGNPLEILDGNQWEIVTKYINNIPESYDDFVADIQKQEQTGEIIYVRAPSPDGSDENFQEFVTWYNEVLFKKLLGGDLEQLPVNYDIEMITISSTKLMAYNRNPQERHSLPYFFYFKDRHGVPYPCYVVTVATPEYQQTFTVVQSETYRQLNPQLGLPDMITEVYHEINSFSSLSLGFKQKERYSNTENNLVDQGFGSYPSTISELPISFGRLNFGNK